MNRLLSNENLKDIFLVNATATVLPFADHSMDRIVALESHQHFKPLDQFINECKRVLKYNGVLVIATPVKTTTANGLMGLIKFGILFLMLRSENFVLMNIESSIKKGGFRINEILPIGSHIYEPLADHYLQNRYLLRENLLNRYPRFIEYILYKSLLKTKDAYKKGIIDYALIKCSPV
jgi:ubiquinone/menaquinone biosynthesis C-methylase UbiE